VEIPLFFHEIFSAVAAAKEKGKGGSASLALYEFAELLKARFGQSDNSRPLIEKVRRHIEDYEDYLARGQVTNYRLKRQPKKS
jgi:hypothetical protein